MSPFASIRRLKRGPVTPGLLAALGAGAALHIAGIALIGATWRMPAPPAEPEVFVRAVPVDSAINEAADLLDPSPLFLPTTKNYGAESARPKAAGFDKPPLPAPTQRTPDGKESPLNRKPAYAALTEDYAKRAPEDQLPKSSGDPFYTLGRRAPESGSLKAQGTTCLIRSEDTGAEIMRRPLAAGITAAEADALLATRTPTPMTSVSSQNLTVPTAEFFVETDAYGASPPQLRRSSGSAECDRKLASALVSQLSKEPLKPGRYTVEAAP